MPNISLLIGKTLSDVRGRVGGDEIVFTMESGEQYRLFHSQDCCESVTVADITGDLSNLVGAPILMADESASSTEWPTDVPAPEYRDSWTWTFYKLGTLKGYVDIRFLGESNGYYSESVDFGRVGASRWSEDYA